MFVRTGALGANKDNISYLRNHDIPTLGLIPTHLGDARHALTSAFHLDLDLDFIMTAVHDMGSLHLESP